MLSTALLESDELGFFFHPPIFLSWYNVLVQYIH